MSFFTQIIDFLWSLVNWWIVVEPWEQAVRVRFGKQLKLLGPGVNFKIPFFDHVYLQNVRRRVMSIGLQTLTTSDGKSITVDGSIGYKIADVMQLHMTLHDAEYSVKQEVLGCIADYVITHTVSDCGPGNIVAHVRSKHKLAAYGLADVDFFLSGYVSNIPTFRLIQDGMTSDMYSSNLSTKDTTNSYPGAPR